MELMEAQRPRARRVVTAVARSLTCVNWPPQHCQYWQRLFLVRGLAAGIVWPTECGDILLMLSLLCLVSAFCF